MKRKFGENPPLIEWKDVKLAILFVGVVACFYLLK